MRKTLEHDPSEEESMVMLTRLKMAEEMLDQTVEKHLGKSCIGIMAVFWAALIASVLLLDKKETSVKTETRSAVQSKEENRPSKLSSLQETILNAD